jgi:hypothetical protein
LWCICLPWLLIRCLALHISIFLCFDYFLFIRLFSIGSICINLKTELKLDGAMVTPKILSMDSWVNDQGIGFFINNEIV